MVGLVCAGKIGIGELLVGSAAYFGIMRIESGNFEQAFSIIAKRFAIAVPIFIYIGSAYGLKPAYTGGYVYVSGF